MLTTTSHWPSVIIFRKAAQVHAFDEQPEAIPPPLGTDRSVEAVVQIPQHVRGSIDQIEVRLAVDPAEGGRGQGQHVGVLHGRGWVDPGDCRRDRLGGPQVPGTDGCRQDQNAFCPWRPLNQVC